MGLIRARLGAAGCVRTGGAMNEKDRWKNRRRMAWLALLAGLAFPLLLLYTDSAQLGAVAAPFYTFAGAVVVAYVGFATWDDRPVKDSP